MLEGFKRFDRAAADAGRRAAAAEAWAEEMRRQRDAAESRMREVVGGFAQRLEVGVEDELVGEEEGHRRDGGRLEA